MLHWPKFVTAGRLAFERMNVGLRILLIEDEARIIELVSRALAREGFVVDAFSTCADGHEALSHIQYDAAILDLGLPDGEGPALLAANRGLPS